MAFGVDYAQNDKMKTKQSAPSSNKKKWYTKLVTLIYGALTDWNWNTSPGLCTRFVLCCDWLWFNTSQFLSKSFKIMFPNFEEYSLQWRHNDRDGVPNRQPHHYLFNRRSKKTSKLRVTGFCARNSPVTSEIPAQKSRNAENVAIWWRHHVLTRTVW